MISMAKLTAQVTIIFKVLLALTATARAEDLDSGKSQYQQGCAACHGIDGKGGGPVSSQLKVPPADLTVLSKKNNGAFPFNSAYEIIDGRKTVAAHGTREMPIWGDRYSPDVYEELNVWPRINPSEIHPSIDPEAIVRLRILAVIDYLNLIQKK
jgi:mono/diheme cytochrome c family protein